MTTHRVLCLATLLLSFRASDSQLGLLGSIFGLNSAGGGYGLANQFRSRYGLPPINTTQLPSPYTIFTPNGLNNYINSAVRYSANQPLPRSVTINNIQIPIPRDINSQQANRPAGCGRSRFSSPLIIGGEHTQKGEWPWFGSLFISEVRDSRQLKLLCGLSLLSPKHVITAAHCIENPSEPHRYTVMLGRHNIVDPHESNYQSRQVTRLEIHPEYRRRRQSADADLAVLKLKQPVQFNDFVQPVCLPQSSVDMRDAVGTVVGYGRSAVYNEHTNRPRKVQTRAVSLLKCLYSDNAYSRIASERNFCAGGSGRSPCKGDSGGGFYAQGDSGQWTLFGMVSEGLVVDNFCDSRKYVVYVDVSKFLRWIQDTIRRLWTDACDPFPCGANSECFVFNNSPFCACREGFRGDPSNGCSR